MNAHTGLFDKVYLIDFGAVANPQKKSSGSTVAGTFGYMSPEQLLGDVTTQSDFYALGATAIHCLCGIAPYKLPTDTFTIRLAPVFEEKIVDYIFGHLDVYGVDSNTKGIKVKSSNSINMSELKSAEVYAGHIHLRQNYKNIHYVGNPYAKVRGEGNTKGITVLYIKTGKNEFYENTYSPNCVQPSAIVTLSSASHSSNA